MLLLVITLNQFNLFLYHFFGTSVFDHLIFAVLKKSTILFIKFLLFLQKLYHILVELTVLMVLDYVLEILEKLYFFGYKDLL